jgi:hypothetical protein
MLPELILLTNGGFEIWQRSTGTIPITVSGTYHADRWQGFLVGTSTLNVAADTTNQDTGSWRCAQCVVTSATLAGPAFVYQQIISAFASGEGQQLRGRVLSFSVRVKTSVANACRIVISDATSSVATYSGYHTGSGTYETLRVTCPAISANCTNANVGIYFEGNGTYFLDNACLVVGAIPADYVPLHSADDLARCLRYCEIIVANSNQYISFAFVYGITTAMGIWQMLPKAITPTATLSAGNTWGVTNNGFGVVPCTAIGATIQTARIVSFGLTTAGGLVAGNSAVVLANTGQTATMTLESNP